MLNNFWYTNIIVGKIDIWCYLHKNSINLKLIENTIFSKYFIRTNQIWLLSVLQLFEYCPLK